MGTSFADIDWSTARPTPYEPTPGASNIFLSQPPAPEPSYVPTTTDFGADGDARLVAIRDGFSKDLGLPGGRAAGILSSMVAESGVRGIEEDPELARRVGQTGGLDFGWAQLHGPRRAAFENWAAQNRLDPHSDAANYGYTVHDLKTNYPHLLEQMRNAPSDAAAARLFFNEYEAGFSPELMKQWEKHIAHTDRIASLGQTAPAGAAAAAPQAVPPWGANDQPAGAAPTGAWGKDDKPATGAPSDGGFWDTTQKYVQSIGTGLVGMAGEAASALGRAADIAMAGSVVPSQQAQLSPTGEGMPGAGRQVGAKARTAMIEQAEAMRPADQTTGMHYAEMAGGFVPALAAFGINPAVGIGLFASSGYNQTYDDAIAHHATPDQANRAGWENAGVQGALSAIPVPRLLSMGFVKVGGKFIPKALTSVVPRAVGRLAARATGDAGLFGGMTAGANVVAKLNFDPDRPVSKGVKESMVAGAVAGTVMHAGGGTIKAVRNMRAARADDQPPGAADVAAASAGGMPELDPLGPVPHTYEVGDKVRHGENRGTITAISKSGKSAKIDDGDRYIPLDKLAHDAVVDPNTGRPMQAGAGESPDRAVGSDAGGGFIWNADGGRSRVATSSTAFPGSVSVDKRMEGGTIATFFIGKDGKLVDADNIVLNDPSNTERIWTGGTEGQRSAVADLLKQAQGLKVGDPARKPIMEQVGRIVRGEEEPPAPSARTDEPPGAAEVAGAHEAAAFVERILSPGYEPTPEDHQFYENNKDAVEAAFKARLPESAPREAEGEPAGPARGPAEEPGTPIPERGPAEEPGPAGPARGPEEEPGPAGPARGPEVEPSLDHQTLRDDVTQRLTELGMDGKVAFALVDTLTPPKPEGEAAPGEPVFGKVAGSYHEDLITLAMDSATGPLDHVNHEIIHPLRERGVFTDNEWAALVRGTLRDPALRASIAKRYADKSAEVQEEEAVADLFKLFARGEREPKGLVKAAYDRFRQLLDAVRSALNKQGFHSPESVMRAIDRGKVGARLARGETLGAADVARMSREEEDTARGAKVIFEVAPDPNNEALSARWNALASEKRLEISDTVAREVIPDVLEQVGAKGSVTGQVGSYLDDTNPSFALKLESGDPMEVAKAVGHVLSQDSMMVISADEFSGSFNTDAVRIHIGNKSAAEVDQIYQTLRNLEGVPKIGGQTTTDGIMTILLDEGMDAKVLGKAFDNALGGDYKVEGHSTVNAAFPEKSEYGYELSDGDPGRDQSGLREGINRARSQATAAVEREVTAAERAGPEQKLSREEEERAPLGAADVAKLSREEERAPLRLRGFGGERAPEFELGKRNPLNDNERIIDGGGITVRPSGDGWRISDLRAIERGGGRRALEAVVTEADRRGIRLEGSAIPTEAGAGKKMSPSQLRNWYEGFGFRGPADRMVREPVKYSREDEQAQRLPPIFASHLVKALEDQTMTRAPAAQWRKTLLNTPGIKAEEMKWSGLNDMLDIAEKAGETIPREDLIEAVKKGGIQVSEVMLDNRRQMNNRSQYLYDDVEHQLRGSRSRSDAIDRIQYERSIQRLLMREHPELETEGGELTRESIEHVVDDIFGPEQWTTTQYGEYAAASHPDSYRELLITLPKGEGGNPKNVPDTHWEQPGVVAHVRFSEEYTPEGERVLMIHEIQSDWHQKGRVEGYKSEVTPQEELRLRAAFIKAREEASRASAEYDNARRDLSGLHYNTTDFPPGTDRHAEVRNAVANDPHIKDLYRQHIEAQNNFMVASEAWNKARTGIPDAPFRKSWADLAMKRMIRYAVSHGNGYNKIAWIRGPEQNAGKTQEDRGVSYFYDNILPKQVELLIKKYGGSVKKTIIEKPWMTSMRRELADKQKLLARSKAEGKAIGDDAIAENDAALVERNKAIHVVDNARNALREASLRGASDKEVDELYAAFEAANDAQHAASLKQSEVRIRMTLPSEIDFLKTHLEEAPANFSFEIPDKMAEAAREGLPLFSREEPKGEETGVRMANDLGTASGFARDSSFAKGRDFKMALQRIARAAQRASGINLREFTPRNAAKIADFIVNDAVEAVKNNAGAIGWYDRKVTGAMNILSEGAYPELKTDPESRFAFTWALAVTSNGLKVNKNFELAADAYDHWKETGEFPTNIGIGEAKAAINRALGDFAKLKAHFGSWEALRDFMVSEHPVREIERRSGVKVSGEGKGEVVRGAAVLGPKIGNGFFSNLYGHFDGLTMDRWLMRTVGRWRGTLIGRNPQMEAQKRGEIRHIIDGMGDNARTFIQGLLGKEGKLASGLSDAAIDKLGKKIAQLSADKDWRARINEHPDGEDLRLASRALAKYLDGQIEQPSGTRERAFLRTTFKQALARLQQKPGMENITMADLQALLWYPEKLLYDSARKPKGQEVTTYDPDAQPDYENAARALVAKRLAIGRGRGAGAPTGGARPAEPPAGETPAGEETAPKFSREDNESLIEQAKKLGIDHESIPELNKLKALNEFHGSLGKKIAGRMQTMREQITALRDAGKLPFEVGTRFSTPHSRKNKLPPWKVEGYHVDSKNPDKYGYRVVRGDPEGKGDYERTIMNVADPAADARRGFDRAADVAQWQPMTGPKKLSREEDQSKAGWTPARIKHLISEYGTSFNDNTKAVAAHISPQQFLDVTTSKSAQGLLRQETGKLDRGNLSGETQTPFLLVDDIGDGFLQVVGHEGRHRMIALSGEGVESVPVVINYRRSAPRAATNKTTVLLRQDHGHGYRGERNAILDRTVPIHHAFREQLANEFGSGDIKFSREDPAERERNLKAWFGNSKVTDENGDPMPVYHSTRGDFSAFKPGGNNPSVSGPAMWFSPDREVQPAMHNVGRREGANVMPVYLRMQNPMVLDNKGMHDWAQAAFAEGNKDFPLLLTPRQVADIKADGYDGIIFKGSEIYKEGKLKDDEYIVFEPEQIKSAIGNRGTFDRTSPDIRYSRDDPEERHPDGIVTRYLGRGLDNVGKKISTAAGRFLPEPMTDLLHEINMGINPMAEGSKRAQATAKDFANSLRRSAYQWGRVDKWLTDTFEPERRAEMWTVADEHGVRLRRGETPRMMGQNRISPEERQAITQLQARADAAFNEAKRLGMVKGDGLESYVPRMVIRMTATGGPELVSSASPRQARRGANLSTTTGQLKQRKYETVEETEAAAKRAFGEGARVVRDIRTLALATQKLERAIAGRRLVDKIKSISKETGQPLVHEGENPDPNAFFTLDHPALQRWAPRKFVKDDQGKMVPEKDENGNPIMAAKPIWISKEFEGPLKAVLTGPTTGITKALLNLKGKMMSVIMLSPMVHNAVIWGKAVPADPKGTLLFFWPRMSVYWRGNAARKDPALMNEAISAGMDPIGHQFFNQDLRAIAGGVGLDMGPGRSWTAQLLSFIPGLLNRGAGESVKRAVDKAGDVWHNKFLWDRIGDLQAGIYVHVRDAQLRHGADPQTAQRIAAHFANRYAGAMPMEAMSKIARNVANLLLFSRSFTLGNLGAYKDMIGGLPTDVRAQIERDTSPEMLSKAQGQGRRKGIAMLAIDIALQHAGLTLAAGAAAWLAGQPYQAPSENEEGKENRFLIGYDSEGTAIYGRLPTGKVAEEQVDWVTSPIKTLKAKLSPYARFLYELAANDKGFGQKLYNPNDTTPTGMAKTLGKVIWAAMDNVIPTAMFDAAGDLIHNPKDKGFALARMVGPLTGITLSKGAPGGPGMGDIYRLKDEMNFEQGEARKDIRKMIQRGDIKGARELMTEVGMDPRFQSWMIKVTKNPRLRMSGSQIRAFMHNASPEQKAMFQQHRQEAAARAAAQ